jgi:hypothetical protein
MGDMHRARRCVRRGEAVRAARRRVAVRWGDAAADGASSAAAGRYLDDERRRPWVKRQGRQRVRSIRSSSISFDLAIN